MTKISMISLFALILTASAPAFALTGTEEVIKLTEKYLKLCRTEDRSTITPSLISDGLHKPPRTHKAPTKSLGDWGFQVEIRDSNAYLNLQKSTGRLEEPFACRIIATIKSDNDQPDLSFGKSHFIPLLTEHLGMPTKSENNSKNLHTALWCETPTAGMELRAKSQSEGTPRNPSPTRINTFTIGMSVFRETTNMPSNAISPCR